MQQPVLFLDIHGVLMVMNDRNQHFNTSLPIEDFTPKCVKVLNEILDKTDCEIIITSTLKDHFTLQELQEVFKYNKVNKLPIGVTTRNFILLFKDFENIRTIEILNTVEKLNITNYCVVDDMDLSKLDKHFVQCTEPKTQGISQIGLKNKIINTLLNK